MRIVALLAIFFTLTACSSQPVVKDLRPNIVLIVSDDMRWDLMSVKNHPHLKTPNIDKLAINGALIENAFVPMALCSPSRASLFTGRDVHKASAPEIANVNNSFLKTQHTVAEYLDKAGYKTAYFGKWHLGKGREGKKGFDHWASFDGLGDFFNPSIWVNGKETHYEGFVDDVLSKQLANFIEKQEHSPEPFFAIIGLKQPHLRFEHPKRFDNALADTLIAKPNSYDEDFKKSGRLPSIKNWLGINEFEGGLPLFGDWDNFIKSHYRAIMGLNDAVGVIDQALINAKLSDNTLVIYTSDNGYSLGDHGLTEKHFTYEEPIRVPLLLQYPNKIHKQTIKKHLVSTLDIAPTILDYASVDIPVQMDGKSLKPLLDKPNTSPQWRNELFFSTTQHQIALRTEKFKLIQSLTDIKHFELYDLESDPRELQSVYNDPEYQHIRQEMRLRLRQRIEKNGWSPRKLYAIKTAFVSKPIPSKIKQHVLKQLSEKEIDFAKTLSINETDISWQKTVSSHDWFDFAKVQPLNKDESIFVAIPMTRHTDWDPFLELVLHEDTDAEMYHQGQLLWKNKGPTNKAGNLLNPPLVEENNIVLLSFSGKGRLNTRILEESPDDSISLPAENGRKLGFRFGRFAAIDSWQPHQHLSLSKQNSTLQLTPTGDQPTLISDNLYVEGPLAIELNLTSQNAGQGQVSWQTGTSQWKSGEHTRFNLNQGDNSLFIPLTNKEAVTALRFNLPKEAGVMQIDHINFSQNGNELSQRWSFE